MKQRGFTVIELIVTLIVIAVIMLLVVASFRSSQVAARNDEQRSKAETIARALENYFQNGNPATGTPPGRYPSIDDFNKAQSGRYLTNWLTGVDVNTLSFSWLPPGQINLETYGGAGVGNSNGNTTLIRDQARANGRIIYEPVKKYQSALYDNDSWTSCYQADDICERFTLYYLPEGSNILQTIRSNGL